MGISIKEIVTGRKTFFITPDTTLLPESFLEDYFALGYECYFIENDKNTSLERKLEILISIFHDVIFFFNIDYLPEQMAWPVFIRNIIEHYGNQASIGVLYTKRQTKEERLLLERKYLYEMGLSCGCIQLEYQKKTNFEIIAKILYANQAQGRRKTIRALCSRACTFQFTWSNFDFSGTLQDLSLSHFSFVYPEDKLNIQLYEKIQNFHFNIKGFIFRSDAVLIMQRPMDSGETIFVFAFVSSTGASGLDNRLKELLVPNIYQMMAASCKNLLNQIYAKVASNPSDISNLELVDDDN